MIQCIVWDGSKDEKGYALKRINGRVRRLHRVVYEQRYGCIPDGALVLHSCHNPSCINPDHLRLGDNAENMIDRTEVGRMSTQILDGWGACGVIADDLIGLKGVVTSKRLGVSPQLVCDIRFGRRWKWLFSGERV